MLRSLTAVSELRRGFRTILGACIGLVFAAGIASAGAAPVIDGNGDDLISFGAAIGADGCVIDRADPRDDVAITDPLIQVCGTLEDTDGNAVPDYFVNGFDLRRYVVVYDRVNKDLYILIRTEGAIGDIDGNNDPDNSLCGNPVTFQDQPGIGSQELYQLHIDTDCDGQPDIDIQVGGTATEQVSVSGATTGAVSYAYRAGAGSGKDLEIKIANIDLPAVFRAFANANASFDGLGEDITSVGQCGDPAPSIDLVKTVNVAVICPGATADFTLVVTNTGNVDLSNVTVVDNLPAGLTYNSTVSNTCGGAFNQVGNQLTYGPFSLAQGASCTIVIRAGRTAECAGEQTNNASVEGTFQSPCFNNGEPVIVSDKDSASVLCGNVTCSINAPITQVCPGGTVEICGPDGDYSYLWNTGATTKCINVGAGTYSLVITDNASGCVSSNPCTVTITENTLKIEVDKSVSPAGPVEQGALLSYTITVTNPQNADVAAQNIVITDVLCDEVLYAGNASPAAFSEPAIGANGSVVWHLASLAPGTAAVFTFDARVRELQAPECESTDRSCTNRVDVVAFCGESEVRDNASVTTPINPCVQEGICRLTGGGCLNEEGDNRGKKQSTFGGNSSPAHEGGGPTGNEWQHVYRDGRTILFNWHSHDAHVIACSVVPPGPCSPPAINTRADFVGTGKYSLGAGSREEDGNMVAYVIDHREGACNRHTRDEYSIVVRTGLVIGEGSVVFQTSGEIDCGNLQIHETPARLFGGATQLPTELGSIESVALLNRAVPNPFTGSMSYAYEITGSDQPVDIGVYNVAGRLVKSLVKTSQPAGRHATSWNGMDENGSRAPAGVYFVRVRLGADSQQHRVIFLGR